MYKYYMNRSLKKSRWNMIASEFNGQDKIPTPEITIASCWWGMTSHNGSTHVSTAALVRGIGGRVHWPRGSIAPEQPTCTQTRPDSCQHAHTLTNGGPSMGNPRGLSFCLSTRWIKLGASCSMYQRRNCSSKRSIQKVTARQRRHK